MRWLGIFLCLGLMGLGFGQPIERIPNPRAAYGGWVVDIAGVLNDLQKARLNTLITQLEQETGAEIAVVVIRKTQGATPKEYATELFNRWGVGKRGADNGVLMLVALQDRRVEVETGYGMEGILPDGLVGAILDEAVIPHFRRGNYAEGIISGVERIAETIRAAQQTNAYETPARPYAPSAPSFARPDDTSPFEAPAPITPALVMTLFLLGAGGIAIAVFLLRERPPKCPTCGKPMHLLDEQADDAFLNALQRKEEQLGSVNYLVWRCEPCENFEIVPKVAWFTPYSQCPKCGGYTLRTSTRLVRAPTYTRTGLELEVRRCLNPNCGYHDEEERVLPKRTRDDDWWIGSTTTQSGSWGGWSGGSSAGGWSGGGWSSGGGSFGGGSSGGGGAGRSW